MSNIPNIRFKGFKDDWENKKFSDVFDGLQNNTFSRAEMNYDSGTIKNIHYGDILVKYGEYLDVTKEQIPYINDNNDCGKYSHSLLHNGDIIIADTAEDCTVGKCTEIVASDDDVKLLAGLHTIPCRPKKKYAPKYLGYYMNSNAYRNQLLPLMQGVKVTSISKSALQETKMVMPSLAEQEKIGKCFSDLDKLISLYLRKAEDLKQIKKFMLQNMFPDE